MSSIFILPIVLPRKTKAAKKFALNLNVYRNTHYQTLSQAKRLFNPIIIDACLKAKKIRVSYTLVRKDERKIDLMNVISIVDKFFLDWLVGNEYIPDDNCLNVEYGSITYKWS